MRFLWRCLILCGLLCGAPARAAGPLGSLLVVGGGDTPAAVQERFVALAGGPGRAKIALFPMASTEFDEEAKEVMDDFQKLGAETYLVNIGRSEAQAEPMAKFLEGFGGYWFLGGDQTRLADTLLGTRALDVVERRYREGAVVGGTSAGAAVMTGAMLTGRQQLTRQTAKGERQVMGRGIVELVKGFGFLEGAIVDQHFLQRGRYNRLLAAVLERPDLIGVGIDEETALLVHPDGRWEVLGDSYVKIFDARRARLNQYDGDMVGAQGIRLHLLPAGGQFEPRRGRATLPGG